MCKMLELTLTCFACGMPSSSLWARRVRRRRPCASLHHGVGEGPSAAPFYSQLEGKDCPPGAVVNEDGTINLCAFCYALLDSAHRGNVEGARVAGICQNQEPGSSSGSGGTTSNSTIWKFVCGVCGVKTYRKRVRALPLQKFHFLAKTRKPGSICITVGEASECAVVCLDCSETLWIQSDEYDRWGLPDHKRHFNWLARPPPAEDSEEANLARLPSGKAQLPRTPPTEPVLPPASSSAPNPESEGFAQMQQKIIRHHQKKAKLISRPHRVGSSSSISSGSNSNSSNSNLPSMMMDFENQPQNSQPMAKRPKIQKDTSSPPWCTNEQSLPHMESLDLSTRYSPSNTSSQQSISDNNGQTVSPFVQFSSQQYAPSPPHPPPLIPLSSSRTMSYLTPYSAPTPTNSISSMATSPSTLNMAGQECYGQKEANVTSHRGGCQNNGSGRQRSIPIPILNSSHGSHGHPHPHLIIQQLHMGSTPELRGIRYSSHDQVNSQVNLHRPHFVYTARPPPTMRETDSAYFRPFLSRIPTRIVGQKLHPSFGGQRLHHHQEQLPSHPHSSSPNDRKHFNTLTQSDSGREIPKSRRVSVPVALGSINTGSTMSSSMSMSMSRSRSRGVCEGTASSRSVALLPKKRRSWDHINRIVGGEGDAQISGASVVKYSALQKQRQDSKPTM